MKRLLLLSLIIGLALGANYQLTSTNDNYLSLVAGFTARMQCSIYRCTLEKPVISWYKDELLLFNGTEFSPTSGFEPENIVLQRTTTPEFQSKGSCVVDEYTLLLKNLSPQDSGKYRCEVNDQSQQLDFHLNVLDSGLRLGFNQNITYDYAECCVEKGISPLCRPMCKPRDMHLEFFDPTSCKTNDYKNFLYCATDGGKRDYIPCCRQRNVPNFCFDFCSNNFQMLKRSHRLCLYYLPEIFECFSQQNVMNPEIPSGLHSWRDSLNRRRLCWRSSQSWPVQEPLNYIVHLKEVPLLQSRTTNTVIDPTRTRTVRNVQVIIAQHLLNNPTVQYLHLNPGSVQIVNGETCIYLDNLKMNMRYAVYIQSATSYASSEPSAPLFIS